MLLIQKIRKSSSSFPLQDNLILWHFALGMHRGKDTEVSLGPCSSKLPRGLTLVLTLSASFPLWLFSLSTYYSFHFSDTYQMTDASRTLVLLVKGATGGSASMIPDSTAPPKQKSMELNQQAKGLTLDTWRAPAHEHKCIYQCDFPRSSICSIHTSPT